MHRSVIVAAGIMVSALLAGSAAALPMEMGYTLLDPVPFSAGSATGTINVIDPLAGNNLLDYRNIVCLGGGTCDIATQDWFVFTITVTGGALDSFGVGAFFESPPGMGYFLLDGSAIAPAGFFQTPSLPVFTFGAGLTGTSLPLFVAYNDGVLPNNFFGNGSVNFMVIEAGGAGADNPTGTIHNGIDIIPEPGTALLLAAGLAMLAAHTRRRRV